MQGIPGLLMSAMSAAAAAVAAALQGFAVLFITYHAFHDQGYDTDQHRQHDCCSHISLSLRLFCSYKSAAHSGYRIPKVPTTFSFATRPVTAATADFQSPHPKGLKIHAIPLPTASLPHAPQYISHGRKMVSGQR